MGKNRWIAVAVIAAASISCASNSSSGAKPPTATPTPAPGAPGIGTAAAPSIPAGRGSAPGSTTTPAAPPAANAPAGAPPAGGPPRGGRGRVPLTPEQNAARRDSLSAMRAAVIQDLMTRIAGSENKRAADEFTNIQLMKDTTAAQLLKTMDYYGRSLSVGCQFCHVGDNKWDDDTKEEKKTTRVMIELVNMINTQGLSKLPPGRGGRTPTISCVTCHRGRTGPGTMLLP